MIARGGGAGAKGPCVRRAAAADGPVTPPTPGGASPSSAISDMYSSSILACTSDAC